MSHPVRNTAAARFIQSLTPEQAKALIAIVDFAHRIDGCEALIRAFKRELEQDNPAHTGGW